MTKKTVAVKKKSKKATKKIKRIWYHNKLWNVLEIYRTPANDVVIFLSRDNICRSIIARNEEFVIDTLLNRKIIKQIDLLTSQLNDEYAKREAQWYIALEQVHQIPPVHS